MGQRYTIVLFDNEDKMMHYINQKMGPNEHVISFVPSSTFTWALLIEYRPEL